MLFLLFTIYRLALGLTTPIESERMCALADLRIHEIQAVFNHKAFYYHALAGLGYENLGRGFDTEGDVFTAWLQSGTHLDNLKAPMSEVCFKGENSYWVMEGHK